MSRRKFCLRSSLSLVVWASIPVLANTEVGSVRQYKIDKLATADLSVPTPTVISQEFEHSEERAKPLSDFLLAVPTHAIPDGVIQSATLYFYVVSASPGPHEIRGRRLVQTIAADGKLRGGWFNEDADRFATQGKDRKQLLFDLSTAEWNSGLQLDGPVQAGYQAIQIPSAWIADWRSSGGNFGIEFRLRDGDFLLGHLSDGAHPPYLRITVSPNEPERVQTRVIANDGIANATWPLNGSKIATRHGRTFVAYTRQDHRWAILSRDSVGEWHQGFVSDMQTAETPVLLVDAEGYLHVFANVPNTLLLRHYQSAEPLSGESFAKSEDVVAGPSHFGGTIGPDGTIYIAYLESGSYDIKIARKTPHALDWTIISVVKSECTIEHERCGHYPSIYVDPENTIHLTYDIVRLSDYVHTMVAYVAGRYRGDSWFRSDGSPQSIPIKAGFDEEVSDSNETHLQGGQVLLSQCGTVHVMYHRRLMNAAGGVSSEQEVVDARLTSHGWVRATIGEKKSNNSGVLISSISGYLFSVFDEVGQMVAYRSLDDGIIWKDRRVLATRPANWPQAATLWFPSAERKIPEREPLKVVFTGIHDYAEIYFSTLRYRQEQPVSCPKY